MNFDIFTPMNTENMFTTRTVRIGCQTHFSTWENENKKISYEDFISLRSKKEAAFRKKPANFKIQWKIANEICLQLSFTIEWRHALQISFFTFSMLTQWELCGELEMIIDRISDLL